MRSSRHRFLVAVLVVLTLACGGDGQGVPDDLERACRQLLECESESEPITQPRIELCRQDLSAEYDQASTLGCADVYADLVSCYGTVPLVCSMQGSGSCEAVQVALQACRDEAQ